MQTYDCSFHKIWKLFWYRLRHYISIVFDTKAPSKSCYETILLPNENIHIAARVTEKERKCGNGAHREAKGLIYMWNARASTFLLIEYADWMCVNRTSALTIPLGTQTHKCVCLFQLCFVWNSIQFGWINSDFEVPRAFNHNLFGSFFILVRLRSNFICMHIAHYKSNLLSFDSNDG